jgi:glycerol-3-phosphate acyltransferase PlsY
VFAIYSIKKIIEPVFFKVLEKSDSSNLDSNNFTLLLFVFLILIIFTHRKNILNLKNRKEHKIKL